MGLSLLCDLPGTVSAGGCETPPVLAAPPVPALQPTQPTLHQSKGLWGKGGQTGNPKVQQCCQGWLSAWQALIIQGIFKIKCSWHGAGESSWHSIQLGLCFGESKGGARASHCAPHSHTAASDTNSITPPFL